MYGKVIYLLLCLFAFLYTLSASKVINTGDAGEFAVGGITLGLAHPSGYPLYMEVLKAFSFLPLGSVPFRMVLVSITFSLLSLYVLYRIVYRITGEKYSALFPVALLGVSYSFWGQSVVVKFYPLNLFIISLMLYAGLKVALEGYDRKYQYLVSFLLGLTLANHHTGFMMVVPLFVLSLFYLREVLRNLPVSLLLFLLGFLANLHMLIRGNRVFAPNPVYDLESFLVVFLRKPYESASSVDVVKNSWQDIFGYYYAIKNVLTILLHNFPVYAFPLFLLGVFWSFRLSKRLGVYISAFFLTYSVFLAKLTFSAPLMSMDQWYIGAHQYFLPMLFGFSLFSGLGLYAVVSFLKNTELLKAAVPLGVSAYALFPMFERLIDQNFNDNYVAYSISKAILSSLPVGSVYLTYGDNHTFESWYFKYVARYREDVCSNDYLSPESSTLLPRGCYPLSLYKNSHVFSEFFKGNMSFFASSGRLYSVIYLKPPNPLSPFFENRFWVFSFALIPKNVEVPKKAWDKRLLKWQELEHIAMLDCASYPTDDRFSSVLCTFSLPMFAYMISAIDVPNPSGKISYDVRYMGNTFRVSINVPGDTSYPGETFFIPQGAQTRNYIELYNAVMENNKPEKFRYYQYTAEYKSRSKK
ncbi:conserved hypothetical protein [Hydrogenobacter thermophilus TK-6]|uniref:glycosyltransferase family 117 protein n=1 Tax=Hydrogenobacter thermophilus TaxID=940 RepID=UPI0001E6567F|nr:DUF2723 domain-containing protein [Hydrogenobacter thermophilus]ADO46026.1 conserved hypothetical protein [Hydrogenobacter thermophilus TK-6]